MDGRFERDEALAGLYTGVYWLRAVIQETMRFAVAVGWAGRWSKLRLQGGV
jgi:hypothetical protein